MILHQFKDAEYQQLATYMSFHRINRSFKCIWQVEKSETCHHNNVVFLSNDLISGDRRYWGLSGDLRPSFFYHFIRLDCLFFLCLFLFIPSALGSVFTSKVSLNPEFETFSGHV